MRSTVGVGAVAGLGIVDGWLPGVAVEKLDGVGFARGNWTVGCGSIC